MYKQLQVPADSLASWMCL